jgi:tripartite-type tricarboxylate transporter receptor subunit TctC
MPSRLRAAVVGLGIAACCVSNAGAADPFYKGRRLSVMINFAPGGSTDIEGRLFARHIAKHIEGLPSIVVQNMDGAGGLNGAVYLGEVAPKDGTALGYLGGTPWQYASEPERFRVDFKSYEFVSYLPGTTVYYARTDVAPGLKDAADIVKATGLVAGGNGPHNARDLLIRLTLDILGVPYRYVTGFRSGQTARLALQRNEISFFAEPAPAYRGAVEGILVKPGEAIPIYYDPHYNGETLMDSKQVEGLPILPFQALYQKLKGTKPSGQLWDVYLAVLTLTSAMGRVVVLPPGAPQEAVMALRAATQRLNHDKEFAEETTRAIGFVPDYEVGADVNRQARTALAIRPEIKAFVVDYIKKASK